MSHKAGRRVFSVATALALSILASLAVECEHRPPPRLITPESELSRRDVWTTYYTPAEEHPLLARAHDVFTELREATGVMADLLVLDLGPAPSALALPDRSILLSTSALELCYADVHPAVGDFFLAWIFGHELDHIGKNDFWHASTYAALLETDGDEEAIERLRTLLRIDGKDRQAFELRADAAGALAAVQAGYDPTPLLTGAAGRFFERWTGGVAGEVTYGESTHPSAGDRKTALDVLRRETVEKLDFFAQGIAALEAAERMAYAEGASDRDEIRQQLQIAVDRLSVFLSAFEGREVLNDLAVAHLRLATHRIGECDGPRLTHFYLPTVVDPVTLASRLIPRGSGEETLCLEHEGAPQLHRAIELLKRAIDRDPEYLLARQNLVAALVLAERPAQAIEHAEVLRELGPRNPHAQLAHPVALLALVDEGAAWVNVAAPLAALEALHERFPEDAAVAYDRAMALTRHGSWSEAESAWRRFLELEPHGVWAEVAREYLGEKAPVGSRSPQ